MTIEQFADAMDGVEEHTRHEYLTQDEYVLLGTLGIIHI